MPAELRFLVGVPASGKSSIARIWMRSDEVDLVMSSDQLRLELTGRVDDFSRESEVWHEMHTRTRVGLRTGLRVVVDATNLLPDFRYDWRRLADLIGITAVAYPISVPIAELVRRNDTREDRVPDEVIERMFLQFIRYCRPEFLREEGFMVNTSLYEAQPILTSLPYKRCAVCGR